MFSQFNVSDISFSWYTISSTKNNVDLKKSSVKGIYAA